jgi:hypothetical protein
MPAMTGSFTGSIRQQTAVSLPDQADHELSLAEIGGTQKVTDENWNNATITYWGFTDFAGGAGTQRGYFVDNHTNGDRDWGTFEGRVAVTGGQFTVEGTFQFKGGTGKFKSLSGGGTFKTKLTSPKTVEASWQGTYELASAKAQAG